MTSPSSKKHPITPWSTLLWSPLDLRGDRGVPASTAAHWLTQALSARPCADFPANGRCDVLGQVWQRFAGSLGTWLRAGSLALVMIGAGSGFPHQLIAAETTAEQSAARPNEEAPSKSAPSLDELRRRTAVERWQRLREAYPEPTASEEAGDDFEIQSKSATPARRRPARQQAAAESSGRPRTSPATLSDTRDDAIEARQGISARPAIAQPSDRAAAQGTPTASLRHINRRTDGESDMAPFPDEPESAPPIKPVQLRKMADINPYYDDTFDKDIREYAKKRAAEYNVVFGDETYVARNWGPTSLNWEASNFYHFPLYFEDPALERYGHNYHPLVQPAVSVGRFGVQVVGLPYHMTLDPVCRRVYSLGWYRPGECAPKLFYQPELNGQAAVVEAGVVTGLILLLP